MKRGFLILMIILFTIILGCTTQEQVPKRPTCIKPQIFDGEKCCMDANDNRVCDFAEPKNKTENITTIKIEPIKEHCITQLGVECMSYNYSGGVLKIFLKNTANFDMKKTTLNIYGPCNSSYQIPFLYKKSFSIYKLRCNITRPFEARLNFTYEINSKKKKIIGEIGINPPSLEKQADLQS